MSSLNKVMMIGRLGKNPETSHMSNGKPVSKFSIAVSETWRDKQTGERKEKTQWVNIVIFNEALAGIAAKYLRTGSRVYVEGQLQTREWQDKEGNNKLAVEVVLQAFGGTLILLDGKQDSDPPEQSKKPKPNDMDDDIPF